LNPREAKAMESMGEIMFMKGDYGTALQFYKNAF